MKNCKICNEKTKVGFNIDFKLIPICESCATSITYQQVSFWATNVNKKS